MPRRALRSYPNYATDLTDEQWAAIASLVVTPSPNGGCPTEIDRRLSVRYYFDKRNRDGTCIKINDTLRKLVRQALERDPKPSISVLDPQSVKTTEAVGESG